MNPVRVMALADEIVAAEDTVNRTRADADRAETIAALRRDDHARAVERLANLRRQLNTETAAPPPPFVFAIPIDRVPPAETPRERKNRKLRESRAAKRKAK